MTKQMITASDTPWPERYTFSPAIKSGSLLFLAGTTAVNEKGELVAPNDIAGQARYIYEKFGKLLSSAGARFEHIVETTDYITTTENYKKTAAVRREFFRPPYPTATGVIVAGLLREGALIEIKAIAILPS